MTNSRPPSPIKALCNPGPSFMQFVTPFPSILRRLARPSEPVVFPPPLQACGLYICSRYNIETFVVPVFSSHPGLTNSSSHSSSLGHFLKLTYQLGISSAPDRVPHPTTVMHQEEWYGYVWYVWIVVDVLVSL